MGYRVTGGCGGEGNGIVVAVMEVELVIVVDMVLLEEVCGRVEVLVTMKLVIVAVMVLLEEVVLAVIVVVIII